MKNFYFIYLSLLKLIKKDQYNLETWGLTVLLHDFKKLQIKNRFGRNAWIIENLTTQSCFD